VKKVVKDPTRKAMTIVASLAADSSFVGRVITSNYEALKNEYPEARPEEILSATIPVDNLAKSGEEWKRALAGLIYANIALGAMQLFRRELRDEDSYFLASIYSWVKSAEILASTNSKALFMIPRLLIDINETYAGREATVTSFIIGVLQKIWRQDNRKAIRFAVSIVIEYSKRKTLISEALEVLSWAQRRVREYMADSELLGTLLRIEKEILNASGRWGEAASTADRLSKIERDSMQKLIFLLDKSEYLYLQKMFDESVKIIDEIQSNTLYSKLPEGERIRALLIKANSLFSLKRYEDALQCLSEAEKIADTLGLTRIKIDILTNKGSLLVEVEKYTEAIEVLEKALHGLREQKEEDSHMMRLKARIMYGLGLSYASLGYLWRGLTFLEKAYDLLFDLADDDRSYVEMVVLLARIIAININLRRWDRVRELIEESRRLVDKIYDSEERGKLTTLIEYLNRIYLGASKNEW